MYVECALLLRYLPSSSPCQGNTASHHHLRPFQTFPSHQCATCIYMWFQELWTDLHRILSEIIFFFIFSQFQNIALHAACFWLTFIEAWRLIAGLAKLAFDPKFQLHRGRIEVQLCPNYLLAPTLNYSLTIPTQHVAGAGINSQS